MEHKWFLLWHPHRGEGADPVEAQINQKEGKLSLLLVCVPMHMCV